MTLIDILTGTLAYTSTWGIYAEKIDGEFTPDSPARFGQRQFENGGLNDDCEYFANNEYATDQMNSYLDGNDSGEFAVEAAEWLIDEINQEN